MSSKDTRVRHMSLLADLVSLNAQITHDLSSQSNLIVEDTEDHLITIVRSTHNGKVYGRINCACSNDQRSLNWLVRVLLPRIGDVGEVAHCSPDARAQLQQMSKQASFMAMDEGRWFAPNSFRPLHSPYGLRAGRAGNLEIFVLGPTHPASIAAGPLAIVRGVRAAKDIEAFSPLTVLDEGGLLVTLGGPGSDGDVPQDIKTYMTRFRDTGQGYRNTVLATIGSPLGHSLGPLINACSGTGHEANVTVSATCRKDYAGLTLRHLIFSMWEIKAGVEILLDYEPNFHTGFLGGFDPEYYQPGIV